MSSETLSTEDFSSIDTPLIIIKRKSSKFYPALFIVVAIILIIGMIGLFILESVNISNNLNGESTTYIIDNSMFNVDSLVLSGRSIELRYIEEYPWECSDICHFKDGSGNRPITCFCITDNRERAKSICNNRCSTECWNELDMTCK